MGDSLSVLRHSIRGSLNAVKLCVSALQLDCTRDEQLEFLQDVIRSSDEMIGLCEELDAMFEESPPADAESNR